MAGGALFAVAGLWESWDDDGWRRESVCLLTTDANEVVSSVHDRMQVILPREAWAAWLDPEGDPAALHPLLRPYPAELMSALAVGDYVSSARNEGPRCFEPATTADSLSQANLF